MKVVNFHQILSPLTIPAIVLTLISCWDADNGHFKRLQQAKAEYLELLAQFPENSQGVGVEPFFGSGELHPMTYGLVLSAEILHLRCLPNKESHHRIHKAVQWLLDNADLDGDGLPGWGLPNAWDAFGDGSVNPANHPYTITTAIVLQGLLDALSTPSLWIEAEKEAIRKIIVEVCLRWAREIWTQNDSERFFWFSPASRDAYFVPNVSAMFLGSVARLIYEQGSALTDKERQLLQQRIDDAARGIVSKMRWRNDAPFWSYSTFRDRPNDLVHHAYILWGMELYRALNGRVDLPWSLDQALRSLDLFWKEKRIHNYPQDIEYDNNAYRTKPAILWGAGTMLAFYARWGDSLRVERTLNFIERDYGPFSSLRLWPKGFSNDETFYARYAAHVLWGLAIYAFRE